MEKQPLLNTYVNNVNMNEALHEICRLVENKQKSYVVAVNTDVIVKAEKDEKLRKIINNANFTLVDGKPLVWISKLHGHPVKAKVSGSDLVPRICKVAAKRGYSIFIIGGKEGVAEKAKDNLLKKFPDIKIVGTYAPPQGFENNNKELEKINNIITAIRPDIVIACFGCPKQEKWVYDNYLKYQAYVSICAGATVDFLAGNVKRAPRWMQHCGLEWFYRLLKEPKRLAKRYLVDDVKIIRLIWKYRK